MRDAETLRQRLRELKALEGPFAPFAVERAPGRPEALFVDWLDEAIDRGLKEPHAMTLSTVDEEGRPDARVLILKGLDERGWHFAISAESRKGRQIAARPEVALGFHWKELGRQVRIRGRAAALEEAARREDFLARTESARAGALIGRQSQVLGTRDELERVLAAALDEVRRQPQRVAESWRLYAVAAGEVEFWQGATDRQHLRLRYRREGEEWARELLWP